MNTRKTSIKTLFTNILCGVFLSVALTSCENFLAGSNVKNELDKAIAFSNARDVNVLITCKEEVGTVFPQQIYKAKVGFDFEIQFIPTEGNYVIKDYTKIFEAVSRIDQTQSRSDCVEFKVLEQSFDDKKAGLYRVNVKVLKYADDIMMQPECLARPAIKSRIPEFSFAENHANTSIDITFNIPVINDNSNAVVFKYSDDCITLSSLNDGDMSRFFERPVLSKDGTKLTLIPKAVELSNFIQNNDYDYIDISVSFSPQIKIVQEGLELFFIQNDAAQFSVR